MLVPKMEYPPELIHGALHYEFYLSDQPYPDFPTFKTYAPIFPSPSSSTGIDLSLRQSHPGTEGPLFP